MAKEKEARRPFNLKKEVKLLPGYIILLLWVIFTIAVSYTHLTLPTNSRV